MTEYLCAGVAPHCDRTTGLGRADTQVRPYGGCFGGAMPLLVHEDLLGSASGMRTGIPPSQGRLVG